MNPKNDTDRQAEPLISASEMTLMNQIVAPMTLKYESDRCHLPPPGAFGGEDSDRKRVGRGFHHVGKNTESGHPRSRLLAVVGSQNLFFIHKPSQKLQLRRPIDRVLANARRGQVLNWFKHLGTIPTSLD